MIFFFGHLPAFLRRRRSFLALSAAGHAGGAACILRCKCRCRPGSVARALGVQSHEIVIAGLLSDQLEPTAFMQNSKMSFYS